MVQTTRKQIDEFWAQKRLALAGISRQPEDFTRAVFKDLQKRGYEMVPVNPQAEEIEGLACYARVQDVPGALDGVIVMTPPEVSEQIVRDCAEAGVKRVWLHRGEGIGAVSDAALAACQEHGLDVVNGYCPYMFMPGTPFFHKFHVFFLKFQGRAPV